LERGQGGGLGLSVSRMESSRSMRGRLRDWFCEKKSEKNGNGKKTAATIQTEGKHRRYSQREKR